MPNGLLLPDFLGAYNAGQDRGKKSGLASLLGQAYNATPEQRPSYLAKIAGTDGGAAMEAQEAFGKQDDNIHAQLAKRAGEVVALWDKRNPMMAQSAYQSMLPLSERAGIKGAPTQLDESLIPGLKKLAMAAGGTGSQVQSQKIGADGYIYTTMRDGSMVNTGVKADRQSWFRDQPGIEPSIVGEGGDITPVGGTSPGIQYATSDGQPIPQSDTAAFHAAMDASNRGESAAFPVGGPAAARPAFTQAPPTQLQINADQRDAERLRLAQEAAARNAGNGDGKPMSQYQRQQLTLKANGARKSVRGSTDDLNRMADMARKVLAMPGLDRITGIMGKIPNIPGSEAADAQAQLESLKSQISFAVLAKMRAMSPTGGALGSVSDAEGRRLEANLASLDNAQSVDQLRKNLKAIIDYADTSAANIQSAFDEDYGDFLHSNSAPQQQGGVDDLLSKYGVK
jgi:hypothetical protein